MLTALDLVANFVSSTNLAVRNVSFAALFAACGHFLYSHSLQFPLAYLLTGCNFIAIIASLLEAAAFESCCASRIHFLGLHRQNKRSRKALCFFPDLRNVVGACIKVLKLKFIIVECSSYWYHDWHAELCLL